jgi:hypothetical protein
LARRYSIAAAQVQLHQGEGREGLLFVNKKKQKNFINLGHGRCRRQRPWPKVTKNFAPLF